MGNAIRFLYNLDKITVKNDNVSFQEGRHHNDPRNKVPQGRSQQKTRHLANGAYTDCQGP